MAVNLCPWQGSLLKHLAIHPLLLLQECYAYYAALLLCLLLRIQCHDCLWWVVHLALQYRVHQCASNRTWRVWLGYPPWSGRETIQWVLTSCLQRRPASQTVQRAIIFLLLASRYCSCCYHLLHCIPCLLRWWRSKFWRGILNRSVDKLGVRFHGLSCHCKCQFTIPHKVLHKITSSLFPPLQLQLLHWFHVGHELYSVRMDAACSVWGSRIPPVLFHSGSDYWFLLGAGYVPWGVQGAY